MIRIGKLVLLLSAILLLNAVTTLLFVQSRVPVLAQVGVPCVDGDVNGDTTLDISDPVYLLQHLFEGGPAPVACAQAPTAGELESVLAKFFPRHSDRFFMQITPLDFQNAADCNAPVLTIPPDKKLVLTSFDFTRYISTFPPQTWLEQYRIEPATTASRGGVLVINGEVTPATSLRKVWAGFDINSGVRDLGSGSDSNACIVLQPGDTLSVYCPGNPDYFCSFYGYWIDAP